MFATISIDGTEPWVAKLPTSDDAKDRRPRDAALVDVRTCSKENHSDEGYAHEIPRSSTVTSCAEGTANGMVFRSASG